MPDKTPRGRIVGASHLGLLPPIWPAVLQHRGRFQPSSVSGFLHLCLNSCRSFRYRPHRRSPSGLPGFSNASVPACHGLRTPADLHALAICGRFVLPSAPLKTSASATSLFRSCSSSSGSAISPAAYRILCLRLDHLVRLVSRRYSAMDPRLDTGGWLALTGEPLDSSFPTGTSTRQDALSFSQRDSVKNK